MTAAEENFYLLEKIDADRQFLLLAMQSNPALLAMSEERFREWFGAVPHAGHFIPPEPTFEGDAK